MSLISDSLKRAHEERNVTGGPSPAFNIVGFGDPDRDGNFSWGRFLILIGLPAVALGMLLYVGINRSTRIQVATSSIPPSMRQPLGEPNGSTANLSPNLKDTKAKPSPSTRAVPAKKNPVQSPSQTPARVIAERPNPAPVIRSWPSEPSPKPVQEKQENKKPGIRVSRKEAVETVSTPAQVLVSGKEQAVPANPVSEHPRIKVSLTRSAPEPESAEKKNLQMSGRMADGSPAGVVSGVSGSTADKPSSNETLLQNAEFYFKMGVFYQRTGDNFEALENYDKALRLDPENAEIYNNRSLIYKEMGKYDRAVRGFLKAIQLDPDYVKAYNNIGLLYYLKNNFPAAVSSFEKAISIDPLNLESYNNLAIVYKKQNDRTRARGLYQTILKKNPQHVEAHYNLALLYEEEGDYPHAIEHYQSFVELGKTQRPELVSRVRRHLELLQ